VITSDSPGLSRVIAQTCPGAFFEARKSETTAAILRVLESGWYIFGSEVKGFEEEFAAHFQFGHAMGVASGTDAIVLALRALGIGGGDRVVTVSHTSGATVAAIEIAGAQPVLAEIDPDTYTMSPASLARVCDVFSPIKAVIAVHLYGHPADMPALSAIARGHGAFVVEDCAQAHGATLNGQFAGKMSDVAGFSFYPTKNLGAMGDGGMVVCSSLEVAERVRMLRQYGWARRFISEVPGFNSRLDEIQAAILRVRLPYLDAENRRRAEIADAYDAGLADCGLELPKTMPGAAHVFHQYVVKHPQRDRLRQQLKKHGVETAVHYPMPVHLQPAYVSRCRLDPNGLDVTEAIANEILSLPMYPELSDADVNAVIAAVKASK
jgi:dTDP-4-amino-4,6-dideoxygalactose transaminase